MELNKTMKRLFDVVRIQYVVLACFIIVGIFLSVPSWMSVAEAVPATSISLNKTATSSCSTAPYEASRAVDGSVLPTSRWYCSTGISGNPLWLQVDLDGSYVVDGYSVTGMGNLGNGWGNNLNPRDFRLQKSNDGSSWTDVDTVTNNSLGLVNRTVTAFTARYVRLYIDYGNQTNHTWASVMEFQVFGNAASSNANLSGLTLSAGTLSPSFSSGTFAYTASVSNATSTLNVTPTVADSTATVKVNGVTATSGSAASAPLTVGSNTVTVLVTAQDGSNKSTQINIIRMAQPSQDYPDYNHDGIINLLDVIRFVAQQSDINLDGNFDVNDVRFMLDQIQAIQVR